MRASSDTRTLLLNVPQKRILKQNENGAIKQSSHFWRQKSLLLSILTKPFHPITPSLDHISFLLKIHRLEFLEEELKSTRMAQDSINLVHHIYTHKINARITFLQKWIARQNTSLFAAAWHSIKYQSS